MTNEFLIAIIPSLIVSIIIFSGFLIFYNRYLNVFLVGVLSSFLSATIVLLILTQLGFLSIAIVLPLLIVLSCICIYYVVILPARSSFKLLSHLHDTQQVERSDLLNSDQKIWEIFEKQKNQAVDFRQSLHQLFKEHPIEPQRNDLMEETQRTVSVLCAEICDVLD